MSKNRPSQNRPTLPFVQQKENGHCGVACLMMVFQSLGVPADYDKVWEAIKMPWPGTNRDYCSAAKMQQLVLAKGLVCDIVSFKDFDRGISFCTNRKVHAILQVHAHRNTLDGHFVTYVTSDNWRYHYVNDPSRSDGANCRLKMDELKQLAYAEAIEQDIKARNTMIFVSHPSQGVPVVIKPCEYCGNTFPTYGEIAVDDLYAYHCPFCQVEGASSPGRWVFVQS